MRTLKKTLSLLLAVALVLSLTVVGASAAYTGNKVDTLKDAADVGADYSEAVGVMVGLGIIEGYDDGTLRPETTYTREQAAKIIAYMQLGPKDADSLRCTKAPFTDVAADRWSAGYIAYCVEQGIIDGMGDGTFQPEAQLTGYQWAKMLLCAVGYGRNDEYVGNSWSLNTAKDALDKGIFDGDLDGADHVVLTRQQAILYAFNTLTSVGVVVYSPSLGDYILRYTDFADRATMEGTLGEKVYGLKSVEGIIVDNEGMGNSKTRVSVQNKYEVDKTTTGEKADVEVAANTDIDMMYHAAKIWHVGSGKTAIYVIDKATVTALTCNNITSSAVAKLEKSTTVDRTIGTDYGYDYYEYNFVDNGDLGTAGVSFYYDLGTLGVRSETRETTVIYDNDGNDDVMANSDIINDIKDLHNRDTVVYIHTNSTVDKTDEAWHVYPISTTTGTVKDYSKTRGTITMADDTVLELSVFVKDNIWDVIKRNAVVALRLDTHGHVIDANAKAVRVIGYFTGTSRVTSAHDAWFHDWTYAAQFVDVTTGEPIEVPVTNTVANQLERNATNNTNGYYDITTAVYNKTALTSATELHERSNIYAAAYAIKDAAATFTASSFMFNTTKTDPKAGELKVFYDNDSVKIFVASDRGTDLTVTPYDGVDDMIEKLSDGFTAKAVYLENIIVSGSYDPSTDAFYADTIFAFEAATASSGYLFLPENITTAQLNDEDLGNGLYRFEGAYLNGSAKDTWITVDSNAGYDRGFYNFTVTNNVYHLEKAEPIVDYIYDQVNVYKHPTNSAFYFDPVSEGATRLVSSEATIVELREEAGKLIVDSVESLDEFWYSDYSDYDKALLQVGYTWDANGVVDVIYVINQKYGTVTPVINVTNATGTYWTDDGIYTFEDKVVFPIYFADGVELDEGAVLVLKNQQQYQYGETADGWSAFAAAPDGVGVVKKDADGDLYIEATIDIAAPGHYNYGVKVTGIYWPDITITNEATDFTFSMSMVSGTEIPTTDNTYVVENLEPGESFSIGLNRSTVADGIEATVDMTGIADRDVEFAGHYVWMKVAPTTNPTNNAIVIESVKAKYNLTLGANDGVIAENYTFDGTPFGVANADSLTFTAVPGDEVTVSVTRTGAHSTDGEGKLLKLHFAESGNIESAQVASDTNNQNQTFTFTFVPQANKDYVISTESDWVEEDSAAVEA